MSFILDALKRSEEERRRQEQPVVPGLAGASPPAGGRLGLPLLGVGLLLNALLLGWLFWPQPQQQPAAAPSAELAELTVEPAPPAPAELPKPPPGALAEAAGFGTTASAAARPPVEPASEPAPKPAPAATPAPTGRAAVRAAPPLLGELAPRLRAEIPAIPVNIHVYSPNPAGRFVLIDMRRYHEGDTLASGPRLETITPQGLVLSHAGTRFRIAVH